jgi:hypothetical protein
VASESGVFVNHSNARRVLVTAVLNLAPKALFCRMLRAFQMRFFSRSNGTV